MRHTYIYSWQEASGGAKELAENLGVRRIKHEKSGFKASKDKVVINWGSSQVPAHVQGCRILNSPAHVATMSNKLRFFDLMNGGSRLPEWTGSAIEAFRMGAGDKNLTLVCRTVLNGHSGAGIIIWEREKGLDIPRAPLYTRYVKKAAEYRVHVLGGRVIDVQRKIKRPDFVGTPNWQVRNHENGFIYIRNGVEDAMPEDVLVQAMKCFERSGLDFGAIDVIWNDKEQKAYVLEINTAPGLSPETTRRYAEAFKAFIR